MNKVLKIYDLIGEAEDILEEKGVKFESSTSKDAVYIVYPKEKIKEELSVSDSFIKNLSNSYKNQVKFEDLDELIADFEDEEEIEEKPKKSSKKEEKSKKKVVEDDEEDEDEEEIEEKPKKSSKKEEKSKKKVVEDDEEDEISSKEEAMEQLKKMQKEISTIRKEMIKIADKFGIVLPKGENKRFKIARKFSPDMPETDGLTDEEVLKLVKKEVKGFDASKYSDKRILRMRAIMAIKDKYEIKPE